MRSLRALRLARFLRRISLRKRLLTLDRARGRMWRPRRRYSVKLSPRPRRTPSTLSGSIQTRLNTYVLAAGAAGVSVLALGQPSEAEIVYTPANVTISRDGGLNLDLNHDGIVDFTVNEFAGRLSFRTSQFLSVRGKTGNRVNCETSFCGSYPFAAALETGSQIGPIGGRHGWIGAAGMAFEELTKRGSLYYGDAWVNVNGGYLGLRFLINGETHYGWARFTVTFHPGIPKNRTWVAQLTGFAYETVANRPIAAGRIKGNDDNEEESASYSQLKPLARGQAAALGRLALGADGVALWRREEPEGSGKPEN